MIFNQRFELSSGDKIEEMENDVIHDEEQATAVENIETLFDSLKQFGQTNIDLFRLKAADKISEIVSSALAAIIVFVIMFFVFIIVSIGLALLVGEALGKNYYGFFAVAGFYLIIGLVFYAVRKNKFTDPVRNTIIKKIFK